MLWTKLLQHTNRKQCLIYRMVPCLVTLLISKRVARVCQRQLSFLLIVINVFRVCFILVIAYLVVSSSADDITVKYHLRNVDGDIKP